MRLGVFLFSLAAAIITFSMPGNINAQQPDTIHFTKCYVQFQDGRWLSIKSVGSQDACIRGAQQCLNGRSYSNIYWSETTMGLSTRKNGNQAPECTPNLSRPGGGSAQGQTYAMPTGSYRNSCGCTLRGPTLDCTCDGKQNVVDIRNCPQRNYCNNHGRLQCGEC